MDTKICSKCGQAKSLDDFQKRSDGRSRDGYRGTCAECTNLAKRQWETLARGSRPVQERWPNLKAFDTTDSEPDAMAPDVAEAIVAFGTAIERACAEALLRLGTVEAAAEELRLEPRQLRAHLSELQRRSASRGYSPSTDMTKPTPEGFHVKGVSTYYDRDGSVRGQWVKTKQDEQDKILLLTDAVSGIADSFRGLADPVPVPEATNEDLLCVYPMGDPHLGMYAWAEETGNHFDLQIAERNLVAAADHLVSLAPPAKHALLLNLGDFFHADNTSNQTSRSHHALDVDTRWGKVLGVGIRVMRRIIDQALLKHEIVEVVCAIGNHDDHSSVFLALALQQYYEREPRVKINTSPSKFHWHRFGKNLIGVTHGDTVKGKDLPGVMASDRAKDWGDTEHRFWYCGHVHHDSLKEFPGVTVETFRTLAARDAWHHASGYRSQRDMKLDVIHRVWGRIQRHVVGINQVTTEAA